MHIICFFKFKKDVDRSCNNKVNCSFTCITSDLSPWDKLIIGVKKARNLTN